MFPGRESVRLACKRSLQDASIPSAPSPSPYAPEDFVVDDDQVVDEPPDDPVLKGNQKLVATVRKRRTSPRQKTSTKQPSASARGKAGVRGNGKRKRDSKDDVANKKNPRKCTRANPTTCTRDPPSQTRPIESPVIETAVSGALESMVTEQSKNTETSAMSSPLSAPPSSPALEATLRSHTTSLADQNADSDKGDTDDEHVQDEIALPTTAAQQIPENLTQFTEVPGSDMVLAADGRSGNNLDDETSGQQSQRFPIPMPSMSSSNDIEKHHLPNSGLELDVSGSSSAPMAVFSSSVNGHLAIAETNPRHLTPAPIANPNNVSEKFSRMEIELDLDSITVTQTRSAGANPIFANEVMSMELDVQLPTPASLLDSPTALNETITARRRSGRVTQPPQKGDGMVDTPFSLEESDHGYEDQNMDDLEFMMTSDDTPSKPQRKEPKASSARAQSQPPKIKTKTKTSPEDGKVARRGRGRPKKIQPIRKTSTGSSDIEVSSLANASRKHTPKTAQPKSVTSSRAKPISPAVESPLEALVNPDQRSSKIVTLRTINLDTLKLSKKLTERALLDSKPEPQGTPLVWADSRQALCETLPYFKKPQGGCYQNEGHIYGFLFDSVGHCREYMDENVIICRAGGGMESDPNGGMVQRKDQLMKEAQVQAIQNDIVHQNPIIVICGNRNISAPCKMPHQYCVLGWYKPVSIWSEKTAGKGTKVWKTIKYRLERLNQAEPAWHAPNDSQLSSLEESAATLVSKECGRCNHRYLQVYLQGWMCLNQDCEEFWKVHGQDAPLDKAGLDYNPAFLLHREVQWGDESIPPATLRPSVPNVGNIIGDNLTYINTRGICCPKCGRCNSRRLFLGWKCENPTCDYELFPQHRPVIPAMLHTPWDAAPTLVRNKYDSNHGVDLKVEYKSGYKVSTYTFEGIKGCFIHAAASKAIVQEGNGPNDMFAQIQTEDLGLERRTFAVKKMSGSKPNKSDVTASAAALGMLTPPRDVNTEIGNSQDSMEQDEDGPTVKKPEFEDGDLMTAFSMNFGMPYKFVANGATRPFEPCKESDDGREKPGAPEAVKECRRRLNWAQREFLDSSNEYDDFNEELIFAYMEGQKIEYHDDGEEGLGPRIATLSLGGRAKMHMRMKQKHYVGCSKTGIFTEERPMPGSIDSSEMYEKRVQKWDELQLLKGAAYTKRRREIPKELGIFEKRMKKADDLVTVTLSHGDIVLMEGYDVQKYLEHKVVPEGYLRFALTCRRVLENHLKPEERPGYSVEKDPAVYPGPNIL